MESKVSKKIVTIIGAASKVGKTADRDQIICQKLGMLLAESRGFEFVIQTGGTGGFPAYVSQSFGKRLLELKKSLEDRIVHYVPYKSLGITKGLHGKTVGCANSMKERREVLMKLPVDVALAFSGGPGTANEINLGNKHKKKLICFVGSGGASAGLIEDEDNITPKIPEECLKNELLCNKDADADTEKIAEAIYEMILQS